MKFAEVHPEEDVFTFGNADEIVAFARKHGKTVRGHTLVWHNQTPDWVFADPQGAGGLPSRETLLARMKRHIDTVVGRYKGTVSCWDVVNEAIDDSPDGWLRHTGWLDIIGEDYIRKAFEYAHEADPAAQLFYNDYNETDPVKREKIYKLVKALLDEGTPIHGIGMQGHWSIYGPPLEEIGEAIERYASLGVRLHVTELDLSVFRFEDRRTDVGRPTPEMMELQRQRYEDIFTLFLEYRSVIDSVTFWGAADDYTWLDDFPVKGRKNWPLLFDEGHAPKESFWRVLERAEKIESQSV
jgi:endo-1,4-beta-xylanase